MLILTSKIQRLALGPKPKHVLCSLAQSRAQSTSVTQEPYWQKIKPWKDVPAEEFKSYRWQVCSFKRVIVRGQVFNNCDAACPHCTGYEKIASILVRCTTAGARSIEESPAQEDPNKRRFHQGCDRCTKISANGDQTHSTPVISHRLEQSFG